MKQKRETVLSILTVLVVNVILIGLCVLVERQAVAQTQERYRYTAANQSGMIRESVSSVLSRAYTLRTLIQDGAGDTSFFDRQAEAIYLETKEVTGITLKNIAVAPGGIVQKVFPQTGNEALAGFDFMDESKAGNAEAIAAYQRGELVITNPFTLVQGGTGLAGRLPVFLENGDKHEFWGLVTVTMDFQELIKSVNLKSLSNMGISYELWYKDESGGRVAMDTSEQLPQNPVTYEFSIENLTWYLDVAPSGGWVDRWKIAVLFCIVIAIAILVAMLLLNRSQIRKANERLQRLAHLDSLTTCYSRHYVNTILVNQRDGTWNDPSAKYSLAIIDVDNFKSINDTYGHDAGDRALIAVAQVLESNSKHANGDCVIRHGGDEFILLFNDVTRDRFVKKLEAVVAGVRKIRFPDLPDMRLSVSIGGEYYPGPEQAQYYSMVSRADEKLYQAKEQGRDRFTV